MKVFFSIATLALALSAVPALAQIGPTEQAAILAAHNNERANTGPSPGVVALTWSTDLAGYAQAWATTLAANDQGLLHRNSSPNPADQTPNNTLPCCAGQYIGENIFGSTAADDGTLGAGAVTSWISEKANYTYPGDSTTGCASGQSCGHYTQVVWKASTTVGCGKATSKSGWTFVVCNYFAPGNFSGQAPY